MFDLRFDDSEKDAAKFKHLIARETDCIHDKPRAHWNVKKPFSKYHEANSLLRGYTRKLHTWVRLFCADLDLPAPFGNGEVKMATSKKLSANLDAVQVRHRLAISRIEQK